MNSEKIVIYNGLFKIKGTNKIIRRGDEMEVVTTINKGDEKYYILRDIITKEIFSKEVIDRVFRAKRNRKSDPPNKPVKTWHRFYDNDDGGNISDMPNKNEKPNEYDIDDEIDNQIKIDDIGIIDIPDETDNPAPQDNYINNSHKNNLNWLYIFWFLFYFALFWLITGLSLTGFIVVFSIYLSSMLFTFSPLAEILWRTINGVRPLRIRLEKLRLYPLFKDVYVEAVKTDPDLSRSINLYIKEDMNVNAFAFGKSTLVITRGSMELLSDECLKGLIAHELGHFSNGDTLMSLLSAIGNFFYSFLMRKLDDIKNWLDKKKKNSVIAYCAKSGFDIIYYIFKVPEFISELLLMYVSRKNEYQADLFALNCGFGTNIAEVLTEIYQMTISKPQSIKEIIKSTHPPITKRIERLEKILYTSDF